VRPAFPDGHFYSPIVDPAEVRRWERSLWPDSPCEGTAIDYRPDAQRELLDRVRPFAADFDYPEQPPPGASAFFQRNGKFEGLDARMWFCLLRLMRPRRVVEVGSGFSSLLAADVNSRFLDGATRITCIEPYPPDMLSAPGLAIERLLALRVQDAPFEIFEELAEGDVLFIDSSHVVKTGSDVNFLYFEVLPRLARGVLIHVHDVFLPGEYPKEWVLGEQRSWSEQYLVQALLMYSYAFEIVFSSTYAALRMPSVVRETFGASCAGGSLWLRKRVPRARTRDTPDEEKRTPFEGAPTVASPATGRQPPTFTVDTHAVVGQPTPRQGNAQPPLLFVQSGSVDLAANLLPLARRGVLSDAKLSYLTHDPEVLPGSDVLPPDTEVLTSAMTVRALLRLRHALRRRSFGTIVVMLTGEPGYRRLKALGLSLWSQSLMAVDERGDCFPLGPAQLWRHLRRRSIEHSRAVKRLANATTVLRGEGVGGFARAVAKRMRARPRRPKLPALESVSLDRLPALPACAEPAISVIIPTFDNCRITLRCLWSLLETGSTVAYEVIIVDDASTDETTRVLAGVANLRLIERRENGGFVAACNEGAAAARAANLFFLNNDAVVTPGAIEALLATLARYPDCGAVGAKLLYPDGTLQEAGGVVWSDGSALNVGRRDDPFRPEYESVREADYCSAAALLVRRSVFEAVGGFDRRYAPAYWEDTDLCFAIRSLGWRVLYQPRAVVVHDEGITSGTSTSGGVKRWELKNQVKFREKWAAALDNQVPPDLKLIFLARDRQRERILLVIDHHVPLRDKDAGSFMMYNLLLVLRRMQYRVVFWPDNLFAAEPYTEELRQAGVEVISGRVDFDDYLRQHGRFFHGALVHRSSMAHKYVTRMKGVIPRLWYVCADLESLREQRRLLHEGGDESAVRFLWEREIRIAHQVDTVAIHSPFERDLLAREMPDRRILLLPLPVGNGAVDGAPFEERQGLLFVGSSHPPNADAVLYYAEVLAPAVTLRLPGVELQVVGEVYKRLGKTSRHQDSGIRVLGYVPSLDDYYRQSRVFVAPLRYGAGVKGKILEAMSHGLPVVTTSVGAEGLPIQPGVDAMVADDVEEFARAVEILYSCRETWQRLQSNGRRLIERHYAAGQFERAVRALMETPTTGRGGAERPGGASGLTPAASSPAALQTLPQLPSWSLDRE